MHWLWKRILQNLILVKIQFFAYFPKMLSWIKESLSQVQNHFTFNAIHVSYKYIHISQCMGKLLWPVLNISCTSVVHKPPHIWMLYFKWLISSTMRLQIVPPPPLQATLPHFVWQHHLHLFVRELYSMVKLPYLFQKAKRKPVCLRNHHM